MSYNFLDKTGLTYFYDKIKTIFAKKSEIPTKTSQLTNDSHLNYSIEKPSGTIDDLAAFTSGKPGITGSISLNKKSSGIGSEIPAGWYNYYFAPHRTGSGGDNMNFGTILLTPMTFSGASWILRRTSSTNAIAEVKKIAFSTDIPTKTSQLTNDSSYIRNYSYYVNTHPENSPVLIPFVNNDIAFLLKRGGSVNISYDGVEKSIDISNAFDGSPSYGLAINPTGITEIVIVLNLHKTFTWNNTIYSDFGSAGWRAKDVKIEVINTNYAQDVWTEKYHNTNNGSGNVFVTTAHTPVGASNQGGGFNKVRFTFKTWATATIFRISQLGIYNYGSYGSRETSMSRGVDDYIFRNITPNSNNTYDLGSSSNKWANVYATTFNGNATSATKATGDKNGADITTTYYKASNPNGYTSNTGTVTSVAVKMNNTTKGTVTTSGTIDLGTVITSHQDISGKQDKLATQTAYTSKGSATKVPQITTNTLGQVTGITEVTITQPEIKISDVQINGTTIVQQKVANLLTNTAYATTNKLATMTDVVNNRGAENPIATILAYAGSEAPNGYLLCRGQAVSRTTYSLLFNAIGTQYGSGDGSTTFNIPDLQGKVIAGLDIVDEDFNVLGKTGGSKTVQLTKNQLPKINGSFTMHGAGSSTPVSNVSGDFTSDYNNTRHKNGGTEASGAGSKGNVKLVIGNDEAHENKQPYNTLNYIIKAYSGTDVPVPVDSSSVKNSYDDSIANVYSTNYINTRVRGKKLWTNPNPTSNFAAQTITFDETNDYDFYKIKIKYGTDERYAYNWQDVEVGDIFNLLLMWSYTPGMADPNIKGYVGTGFRPECSCDHNSITFTNAVYYTSMDSTKSVNDTSHCIPLEIYGYYI